MASGQAELRRVAGPPNDPLLSPFLRPLLEAAMQVDAGVRGAADILSLGWADEAAAAANALLGIGGPAPWDEQYATNLQRENARDQYDVGNRRLARTVGQLAGAGVGMAAAARAGGGPVLPQASRLVSPVGGATRSAIAGAGVGAMAGAGGAAPDLRDRGREALSGAAWGAALGPITGPAIQLGAGAMSRFAPQMASALRPSAAQVWGRVLPRAVQPSVIPDSTRPPAGPVPAGTIQGPLPPRVPYSDKEKKALRNAARAEYARANGIWASEMLAEVHHRVELQLAHLFRNNPNRVENLVGLRTGAHDLAGREWDKFIAGLGGRTPTQAEVIREKLRIDALIEPYAQRAGVSRSRPNKKSPKRPMR